MNIVIMDQLYTEIHEYWWNHSNCCYIDEKVAQKSSLANCINPRWKQCTKILFLKYISQWNTSNFTQYKKKHIHVCMLILFCVFSVNSLVESMKFLYLSFTAYGSDFFTCSVCFRWDKARFDSAGQTGHRYSGGWRHRRVSLLRWWVKATVSVVPIWWSPCRLHPDQRRPDHSQHPALWRRSIHLYSHCSNGRTRHGYYHRHRQPRGYWWVLGEGSMQP